MDALAELARQASPHLRPGGSPLTLPSRDVLLACATAATVDSVGYDENRRRIEAASIDRELAAGRTVIVNGAHAAWPEGRELAAWLSVALGADVRANFYLTPAHGLGFPVHADRHDVLVMQLAGSKRWLVYEPGAETPMSSPVTRAGDLLFLPRGFPHMAAGGPELSVHATFGVHRS